MFKGKKGVLQLIGLFASPWFWIAAGILLLLIILSAIGLVWIVATNVFTLLGVFLVVVGAAGFLMKLGKPDVAFTFIAAGVILLVLPLLFKRLDGVTLAAVLP